MKIKYILIVVLVTLLGTGTMAQVDTHILNAASNGTTVTVQKDVPCSIQDDGGENNYSNNIDFNITITSPCPSPLFLGLEFTVFDIASTDTLFIYDGPSTASPLLIKSNNSVRPLLRRYVYPSVHNLTNTLTLRLKTASNSPGGQGFVAVAGCDSVCEIVNPVIDSVYYRTHNGVVYDTSVIKMVYPFTVDSLGDTIWGSAYRGANLCIGDGIIFKSDIQWDPTYATGHYIPSVDSTNFIWHMDADTISGKGLNEVETSTYEDVGCYHVILETKDQNGCRSTVPDHVVIRIAQNPIKTIFQLAPICTGDTLITSIGYDGENASITLRPIEFNKTATKVNATRTFIPDGPHCDVQCYVAPVTFRDFPSGKKIKDAAEVCSLCINYEHTFMGDYRLALICPNGNKAVLKFASTGHDPQFSGSSPDPTIYPNGSYGGGGTDTGVPLRSEDGSDHCDSLVNPFGVGWNYCFSRNEDYTLFTGDPANSVTASNCYLGSSNTVSATVDVPASPAYFTNPFAGGTKTVTTQDSSDHDNKTGYYMPWSDFSELVDCPMNGEWKVEVCDYWGADNGWIFSWSLDLCGITSASDCNYQVDLDSVVWLPDTVGGTHCDYETGKYRGLEIFKIDSISSGIMTADTAGYFPIDIILYDEFGCVWDTSTSIKTTWTPRPSLGEDSVICGDQYIVLDAKDNWADREFYSYMWDPVGQGTDTIHTTGNSGQTITYTAEVYNTNNGIRCTGRDNVDITISKQPIPNIDMNQYPLEGCEPFTVNIKNNSIDAVKYRWVFGDGEESTEEEPRHTYKEGTYDFKFYVTSDEGCIDSLIYDKLVTVYPSPDARFSWDPVYPTMTDPTIHLENATIPDKPSMKYFWEIQYDKNYPYSYHTLVAKDTSFTWETNGEDISGDYIVRLIARSDNMGPSGNIVHCADTIENTVLLLNDFIQFPNLVTPNGDGINDKFVIINLISGQAYPTNQLDIYNKWGARVYHVKNITSEDDFWDPASDNIPAGTYFYHFTGKGYNGSIERNGAVEVVK